MVEAISDRVQRALEAQERSKPVERVQGLIEEDMGVGAGRSEEMTKSHESEKNESATERRKPVWPELEDLELLRDASADPTERAFALDRLASDGFFYADPYARVRFFGRCAEQNSLRRKQERKSDGFRIGQKRRVIFNGPGCDGAVDFFATL